MIFSSFTSLSFSSAPFVLEICKDLFTLIIENRNVIAFSNACTEAKMNQMDISDPLQFGPISSKTDKTSARVELMFSAHGKSQPQLLLTL